MNNLRASIEILFRNICPDRVIEIYLSREPQRSNISLKEFSQQAFGLLGYYSHDEIENLYAKVCEDWAKDSKQDVSYLYQLVYEFSSQVLTEEQSLPKVQYEHLLRWRDLSHRLGEDIFVCNYLAFKDNEMQRQRTNFNWRPVLDTNNTRLRTLLSKGVAENHFHLFGSAPYGELSWIALMNNITGQLPQFKKLLKDGLLENSENTHECEDYHLYFLVIKAALIRANFFSIIKLDKPLFQVNSLNPESSIYFDSLLHGNSNKEESVFLASQIPTIQNEIDSLRFEFGLKYADNSVADYAISKTTRVSNDNGNVLLSGERWFLYTLFSRLQDSDKSDKIIQYKNLFYAYLLCKSKFREEMLQINNKTGFANFSKYQKRKELFLNDSSVFLKSISGMAIRTSNMNQKIINFETRIKPDDTNLITKVDKNVRIKETDSIDRFLNNEVSNDDPNHFYVVHFIKEKEQSTHNEIVLSLKSRHWKLRDKIKKQTNALISLREDSKKEASRIYGIDAAANELHTRPEVFASIFRLLKQHHPKQYQVDVKNFLNIKQMPRLRATYHVGEDFLDIVDGLRAIDEAIKFLGLGEGDRIGHALALGVDVDEYYLFKHKHLLLPKQNMLDNYSWILSRIAKYGMNEFMALQSLLLHEFRILFQYVYGDTKLECDPIAYYQAWTLRGDDPDLYITGEYPDHDNNLSEYDCFRKCNYPDKEIRNNNHVVSLLEAYQYNTHVKKKGAEIFEFKVKDEYIKAVKIIQMRMQHEITQKHIAIECNPSSNVLIGTFKRYDKHPIVNFYNLGLTSDANALNKCPQLMVSINTDDQGVFNTYLENEYAFMAKALEKAKDKDGNLIYNNAMIHDWLERIRQMGLEMSFNVI